VYSARDNKARCVARVRIPTTFLTDIQNRIGRTLNNIQTSKSSSSAATPIFLFRRPADEGEDN
jgi:hypothetical protein